jgi:ATP-dependent helicase Lhr and Lhr-like helicase
VANSSVFERFHPTVQRWIWDHNWTALRVAQERAAPWILDGEHDVLVAAGTGQGKTEAAFFPLWTRIADNHGDSVRILYIAPLKALINDQYLRQESYCEANQIRVTAWHGDASATKKRKLVKDPAGILLITPESLEAILVRHGAGASKMFRRLDRVVIDEVHAFFDTERGRQLQSLLARVESMIGRRVPRIGLSATLGDDRSAATDFLRPRHGADVGLVEIEDGGKELQLAVHGFEVGLPPSDDGEATDGGAEERDGFDLGFHAVRDRLYRTLRDGSRHLVFANRRDHVEKLTDLLRRRAEGEGVPNTFFAHHGSLAKELREGVEHRLKDAALLPTVVMCTSTLEMGIDIGQMASVAQVGCPPSVASLRQRLGRSGRGENEPHVLRVCVLEPGLDARSTVPDRLRVELVQALAMIELIVREKWCEPPRPGRLHLSTLLQQILAVIMQNGGVRAQDAWVLLCRDGAFQQVDPPTFGTLVRAMAKRDLLYQTADGTLVLTEVGEKITNYYGFYVVFQTGEEFRLMCGARTLGHLPVTEPLVPKSYLIFGGRRWRIVRVDDARKIVELTPATGGRTPRFEGRGGALVHDRVRERMRDLYASNQALSYLDPRAARLLAEGRQTFVRLGLARGALIEEGPRTRWIPWAGDRVLNALALWLRTRDVHVAQAGLSLELNLGLAEVRKLLQAMASEPVPDARVLANEVQSLQHEKYDQHVPRELLVLEYADRFLDVDGAARVVHQTAWEGTGR